ncbi:glycine betaine ABC transporter substrate-binding protein [Desulfovibrio ferrophilus]|nr:glycine betaine ABC transporter substrate-binding protein [Desulfovibrio ferrophilus]
MTLTAKVVQAILLGLFAITAIMTGSAQAGDKVELAYVEWAETVASTSVVQTVLQDLGYEVETIPVSAAVMWQGTAWGNVDAFTGAWLPVTHGDYRDRVGDKLDYLGKNLEGARIGLVVPAYVELNSIADLRGKEDMFKGLMIGIDPGAGIMSKAELAIKEYDLDIELMGGSGATMTAVLKESIEKGEPVVVTGWTPHWKFGRWDLKYLDDPKKVFGDAEFIGTYARKGLAEDMPEVYAVLDAFHWTLDDCQQVMLWARDMEPEEAARKWVDANPDKVAAWLPKK